MSDDVPDGLILCDTSLNVVDVNEAAQELLGVTRDRVVRSPLPLDAQSGVRVGEPIVRHLAETHLAPPWDELEVTDAA